MLEIGLNHRRRFRQNVPLLKRQPEGMCDIIMCGTGEGKDIPKELVIEGFGSFGRDTWSFPTDEPAAVKCLWAPRVVNA